MFVFISNVMKMPVWLKLLAILGLISPLLVLNSALMTIDNTDFNNAQFILILLSSGPIFISSVGIILMKNYSRFFFTVGWIVISLPSILIQYENDYFLEIFAFNIFLAIIMLFYLYKNKDVVNYFEHGPV